MNTLLNNAKTKITVGLLVLCALMTFGMSENARADYRSEFIQMAQWLTTQQVTSGANLGGIWEGEDYTTVVQTDNTTEAIWIWSRYAEITGDYTTYLTNINNAWIYCHKNPSWHETPSSPTDYYNTYNVSWGLLTETKYRQVYGGRPEYVDHSWYGEQCAEHLVNNTPGTSTTADALCLGFASGALYQYSGSVNSSTYKSRAVTLGGNVRTWLNGSTSRFASESWAVSGGIAVWGVLNSYYKDPAYSSGAAAWATTANTYMPANAANGANNSYEYGHDAWFAWGHYAVSEYLGSGSYTKYQNIIDLLLGTDGDNDGGIRQGLGYDDNQDYAWTTSVMQAAINLGLLEPSYQYTISGTITYGGSGFAGIKMNGLSSNPVTDANGFYSTQVVSGWSGTVTPSKTGYAFTPATRTYSNVTSNQTGQDHSAGGTTADTIIYDAVSSNSSASSGTTLSWSHTVGSGNNRLLIVSSATEDSTTDTGWSDATIESVTFNGINMMAVKGSSKRQGSIDTDLWYLPNPPTGTYTIQINYFGTVSYRAGGAISLKNIKQQEPEAAVTNGASSTRTISSNITTLTNDSWVIDVVGHSVSNSFTAAGGTKRWDRNTGYHTGAGTSLAAGTAGSKTLGWTLGGSTTGYISHSLAAFAPSETSIELPAKASGPNPNNSAANVDVNADLSWAAGSGATSHDVYFGTSSPGTFHGNQAGTTFEPGTLSHNTTYYWRIDEKNTGGTTTGDVWSFTTNALVLNVLGMTQTNAATVITNAGLAVGNITAQYSDTIVAGLVIGQNPIGGTTANTGSSVDLVISLGQPVVPNVVGMTQAAATSAITSVDNLTVGNVTTQYSNTVTAGLVISQNPIGGTAVNTGSSVDLVISLGQPVAPNVVGMTQAAATSAITSVDNLIVGNVTTQYSDTVAAGLVISQNPIGGTAVNTGSSVDLVISLGQPVVPNVVGMTQADATLAITAVDNLIVGTVITQYSDTVAAGLVINQNPVGGTAVNTGSSVDLVISLGPQARIISGHILEPDGNTPVKDVLIDANNNGGSSDITDVNGYYEIPVPYGWSGTATPSKIGYTFEPNVISYNNVIANEVNDYTAILSTFIISGYVLDTDAITPISDVNILTENGGGPWTSKYGGGYDTTDVNGYYEVAVDYNWSGKITLSKYAYGFEPNSKSYINVISDQNEQNYNGMLLTFVISGYVRNDCNVPIRNVDVAASSGGNSTVTDVNGHYEIWVDYNWSGTVTLSKNYYTFVPASSLYTGVISDKPNEDYLAINIYDLDCDGSIGYGDLAVMAANWLKTPADIDEGDFNEDSSVNFMDYAEFADTWQ